MEDQTLIDCLYEELVMLDEQAGCFDEVTNRFIDEQRGKLFNQLVELEAAHCVFNISQMVTTKTTSVWFFGELATINISWNQQVQTTILKQSITMPLLFLKNMLYKLRRQHNEPV